MKFEIKRFTLFLAMIFGVAQGSLADPKAPTVSFDSVLAQALSQSPLVKQIDAGFSSRLADAIETKQHLNPQLSAGVGLPAHPVGTADKTQISLSLSQPLRVTDFGLRDAVSELMKSAASSEQRSSVLELTQSIYLSFAKLWVLQEQKNFLLEQKQSAKRIGEKINAAIPIGAVSKAEGGLFNAEHKKLSAQALGVDANIARESAALLKTSTVSVAGKTLSAPEKTISVSKESLIHDVDEEVLPVQLRYALLARVASERERLARTDAFPAFAPQLSYQRTEDGGSFMGVGIQLELPIFNRNEPDVLRRRGEADAANAQRNYLKGDVFKQEISLSLQGLAALKAQAEAYQNEVIPSLVTASKSYEQQFFAGGGSVLSLWQSQREISTAEFEALELWTKYFSARSELSILTGQPL